MQINSGELEKLISELMKEKPDQEMVKTLMIKHGIHYSQDPFQQMNEVLQYMNQKEIVRQIKENESTI
jgi:precorrin isomerase